MNIRQLTPYDVWKVRRIHEEYFANEFEFPDFFNKFHSAFVIEKDDQIIAAGGVRSIAEAVAITDMNQSVRTRREALYILLQASLFTCSRLRFDQLHAFVQDEKWLRHLQRAGFEHTRGTSLFLGV